MTMTNPKAGLHIGNELRHGDAALDGALLAQTGLLATLISARRDSGRSCSLGHAELMRLARTQRSLLSPAGDAAAGRLRADNSNTSPAPLRRRAA